MASVAEIMRYVEHETDLDIIAIADHDQIDGALEAARWCAERPTGRVSALVGTEISASWGRHVLALFFEEPYPQRPFSRFKPLRETVERVRDAGGLVVVPHALSALVPSLGERALAHLLASSAARATVAGVETCSGVVGGRRSEARLRRLNAAQWRLANVGSSDAHHLIQIGSAYTTFPGRSPVDLRAALMARTTQAHWAGSEAQTARVPVRSHAHQGWRSLVVKPARELRAVLAGLNRSRQGGG